MPVEVPGASYGVEEEKGIATVFKPLNITWEVTDATLDQANVISRMSDYLTANRKKIKAIIGLGDLVTGSIKRVFDQVGVKPGEIPVVGWGNSHDTTGEVMTGYVNAGEWQDPQATSYLALSFAAMATDGIPPGFNITVGALYEKDTAASLRQDAVGQVDATERRRRLVMPRRAHKVRAAIDGPPSRPHPEIGGCAASASERQLPSPSLARPSPPSIGDSPCRNLAPATLIAAPEFGPFVLLVLELVVFSAINPDFPVRPQHQQHADLHGRTRPDRARDDAADDRGRIRSLRRLAVRLRAGPDVDAVQHRLPPRSASPSSSPRSSRR